MEIKAFKPYLIMLLCLGVTSFLLGFTVRVDVTDEAGVRLLDDREDEQHLFLPDTLGEWVGHELRFCQNPGCRAEHDVKDLKDIYKCPRCGSPLYFMTLDEYRILPKDTVMVKKRYEHPMGRAVFVTVVLSGRERSSIHRPQRCLTGQGNTITGSEVMDISLQDGRELDVMLLDMTRNYTLKDGRKIASNTYYAYWFVGRNRETPNHITRMIWMAADRIFKNKAHRWAYIGIAGVQAEDDSHKEQISEFVRMLYPEIIVRDESS